MVEYVWPDKKDSSVLGGSFDKIDGVAKCTGTAKYSYDINPDKVLIGRALGCPHAHCKIKSLDLSKAEQVSGVVAVREMKKVGDEIQWQGDLIAVVVGETEGAVAEGLAAVAATYEPLDVFVADDDLEAAEAAGRTAKAGGKVQLEREPGDDEENDFEDKELERLFKESAAVVEGLYGISAITHMCLEPHGSTCDFKDGKLTAHLSTQNVSGTPGQFAAPLKVTADDVTVHCDYIGGGFGSKFAVDRWDSLAAQLSKELGRPVKLMLDRDLELKNAGSRPSGYALSKVGADKDGVIKVWDTHFWSAGGFGGAPVNQSVIPYVIVPPNYRRRGTNVKINTAPVRAWRAPNHPQGCAMTQTSIDDVAAKLGLDSYDVFERNLVNVEDEDRRKVYAEEMKIAAKLMDWKAKWHPHGKGDKRGSVVDGLGMAIHTWGGGGHPSTCMVKIHPDGGVETFLGSQDLGTGTRTVIAIVLAETFGLPVEAIKVNIGSSKYPASGPSGGSTTVGGVSESNRRTGLDALAQLNEKVASKLGVPAESLVAKGGRIFVKDDPDKGLSWKEACSLLGMSPLEVTGRGQPGRNSKLSSSGVAGVQMAEVEVDRETGQIKMKKFVAVQDMGLVVNRKTASSQIYGAMIMGIAYSLFEERIMDPRSGAFLNAEIADYRLPRLGDVGELVVEIYEPESERERGVIGLGEPPVISPGAAISNAVANALGIRVPVLPMTPKRVLDTLQLQARNA